MKLGAQLYTVREHTQTLEDLRQTLRKVSAMGYRYVHNSKIGPIPLQTIRELLDENGLKCTMSNVDSDRLLEDPQSIIRDQRILGCSDMCMSIMPDRFRGSAEGAVALAKALKPVVRQIRDAGMVFHYHNHDVEFKRAGRETCLDILLNELPEANLLLCAFWAQVGGANPLDIIEKYDERITHIHLKDMSYGGNGDVGTGRIMTPIMEGNMNYPAIVARLAQKPGRLVYVEQDTCQGDPFDCLRISHDNLRTLPQLRQDSDD